MRARLQSQIGKLNDAAVEYLLFVADTLADLRPTYPQPEDLPDDLRRIFGEETNGNCLAPGLQNNEHLGAERLVGRHCGRQSRGRLPAWYGNHLGRGGADLAALIA